jgi:cytochrome c
MQLIFMTFCKKFIQLLLAIWFVSIVLSCNNTDTPKVLVFSKTEGYRHASIEPGIEAIKRLGSENGFQVDASENADEIKEENLKTYAAVIFLNTTGDILDHVQQADFERYIQAGGGFVGIHSAADTEYDWIWYGKLVGGYFNGHPSDPDVRDAKLDVLDKSHPSTAMLPDEWDRTDEWYNYKNINPNANVLINLDETSYEGGTNGEHHPIAIYHEFDGGRAFYTGGGHTTESYEEPLYLAHLLGGIQYAMGDNKRDYSEVHFKRVPAENRFVKTVLARNLNEPMELEVLEDGKIIFVERKGNIKLFDPNSETVETVTEFPVHTKFEDGLLGITLDPNYESNKWIYLFYSPVGDKPVQHVSRFVFDNDSLHYATEKVLLEIPVQRDECCHSGGSLEFGPDGNLFIGVGDNTNPFASDGYAPIDERPGRTPWDGQRAPGNTNDLRGKILRITPQADGSYTIPEGNLFPEGTPKTRPEIYVMGCRNPFRINIDSRTKYLYWGDVGPDAGKDNPERGSKGIDEFNQARQAGNWGWPYTRGNNQAYRDYNFTTEESGPYFDPENPINDSPNNTGLRELPPTNKSVVWYSYDKSKEFPWVGVGGKNPMAGPVYYSEDYEGEDKFPDYFDGKLIAYEWMRHWIHLFSFDDQGDLIKVEPFMQNNELSRPMDMVFGKDGKLYMIEYGQVWFAQNMDARLSRIDYIRGNRAPIAKITADKTVGGAPFTVILSAAESYDFDHDKLKYEWNFGDGSPTDNTAYPRHTYEESGVYTVTLVVTDPDGQKSTAKQEIQVGNDAPKVNWALVGNQTFYWDNRSLHYQVNAIDAEDGSTLEGSLSPDNIQVTFDYLSQGYDITEIAQGHQLNNGNLAPLGKRLIDGSDCKNCHAKKIKVNGPSYLEIANKYSTDPNAPTYLGNKIITGGNGVWGETVMSAHPQLSFEQAKEIAGYILSLNGGKKVYSKFPAKGKVVLQDHISKKENGIYILMASYTDKGNDPIDPITTRSQITLRHQRIEAEHHDVASKEVEANNGTVRQLFDKNYIGFYKLDLTDIETIATGVRLRNPDEAGGTFEVRVDSPKGDLIGSIKILQTGDYDINVSDIEGLHDLYFVAKNEENTGQQVGWIDWIEFRPNQSLTMK